MDPPPPRNAVPCWWCTSVCPGSSTAVPAAVRWHWQAEWQRTCRQSVCQVCVAALYASTELRHSEAAVGLMPPSRYSVWLCRYTGRVSVYSPAAETGVLHHPLSHTRCSKAKVTAVWTARRFRGCGDLDHLGSCAKVKWSRSPSSVPMRRMWWHRLQTSRHRMIRRARVNTSRTAVLLPVMLLPDLS